VYGYRRVEDGAGDPEADAGVAAITALVDSMRPLGRERTRLLRTAAHELRTPLTAVTGFIELLVDRAVGPVSVEQERVLRTVAHNAQRLTVLIDALEPSAPGRSRGDLP
jgi:signal transduction histidine kinase